MKIFFLKVFNFTINNIKIVRYLLPCVLPYIYNLKNKNFYQNITFDILLKKKKSNTVFFSGTGPSINEIENRIWKKMEGFDVISFRDFPKQTKVNVDYHVTGEIDDVKEYAYNINNNPKYKNTYFLIQEGFKAHQPNTLLGKKLLKLNSKIFRYKRKGRGKYISLSKKIDEGIVHGFNSIISVINLAFIMGWKKIILVGIDMHNHSYFYYPENKIRKVEKKGITLNSQYTNREKTLELLSRWIIELKKNNVELFIYNKDSYLKKIIPRFKWSLIKNEKN